MVSAGAEPAEETSTPLENARHHRRALAGALHYWSGDALELYPGHYALFNAYLVEGEGAGAHLWLPNSRVQPWRLRLETEARRLSGCEATTIVLWDVQRCKFLPKRLGCMSRLCPVCARVRASRALARWLAILEAACKYGAVLTLLTLTQRSKVAEGGLITAQEQARGWKGTLAGPGVTASAVAGEQLHASYNRFRDNLRKARQGRATRARWREGLGGYLIGMEWTGRQPGGVPRWHVHLHTLCCTLPGDEPNYKAMVSDWVRLTGGSRRAQHVQEVGPDRVVEVMKYPFKPAHLTSAQRIEVLATARGLRPHQAAGAWDKHHSEHFTGPWHEFMQARPVSTERFQRLYVAEPASVGFAMAWRLYTGDPSHGRHTFMLQDGTDKLRVWEQDAREFCDLVGKVPGWEEPEPGSETDIELFEVA